MDDPTTKQKNMIDLSVVIPTYNRSVRLKSCLEALARQTQSASDFEVIVVIDGSTDDTVETLKKLNVPYLLRTVWQENKGQPSALNEGIKQASGRYCLFLDDDIIADPQLVAEHLEAQREHEKAVVVGQIKLQLPAHADWYAIAFAQGWRDHYDQLNQRNTGLTWEDCYSGNMSAPRESLLSAGGFVLDMIRGYDVELVYRLEKQGLSLLYVPGAVACQDEQKGFHELSQDAENAGKADVLNYQQNTQLLSQALASFSQGSWRKLLLRRLLLAIRVPPRILEQLGRGLKNPAHRSALYGFIQWLCYWRGVRQMVGKTGLWQQLTSGVPILMYHAIGLPHEPAGPFVIPAERFSRQMDWLKKMGYHPIPLTQFLDCQQNFRLLPPRCVVITFDDGYADNYTHAYPILRHYNIPVTIFLVSSYMGLTNGWDQNGQLSGRPLMSCAQIQELISQGVHVGAHSCTHPELTAVSSAQAEEEIIGSRQQLESKLGVSIDFFAFPYGKYDPSILAIMQRANFLAGCTIETGLNTLITPSSRLRRTEIQGTDSLARLWLALWTGDAEALWWHRKPNRRGP